jgi:large subunit ribosomal protein L35
MTKTKLKTKKAVTRRITVTKNGKLMRRHGFNRHLKKNKTKSAMRNLKRPVQITGKYAKKIRQVLGI